MPRSRSGSTLPSLKYVAGLEGPEAIARLHARTSAQFWTGFGQTETSGFVTLQRVADHPGSAGKAAPLCQIRLVDEADRDVPIGTPGEILVRGPVVFQGYFDQPEVTAQTFRGGWHHTGDVGRFDTDGYLYYVQRKPEKALIKPGGENVYPAEVEAVIMELEGVTGVCVFGVPDAQWGEAIKAVVEVPAARAADGGPGECACGESYRTVQAPQVGRVHDGTAEKHGGDGGPRRGTISLGYNLLSDKARAGRRWLSRAPHFFDAMTVDYTLRIFCMPVRSGGSSNRVAS